METGLLRTDGLPEGTGVPFVPGIQGTGYWEPPAVPFGSGWLLGTPQGLWESAVGQADLVPWAYEPVGVTGATPLRQTVSLSCLSLV